MANVRNFAERGIVLAIVWSVWIGSIIVVVGLVAFGGFAKGNWY